MAGSTFQTNPVDLHRLLDDCHRGDIQLPDFQRGWVWDEDRIKSLIASVSRAFPIGALMSLDTGGSINFKPRMIEGAPRRPDQTQPRSLLLDGQQRLTSLYQVTLCGKAVETVTPRGKLVKRWFYIDIARALDEMADREDAIISVPEDRIERTAFGREVVLDLSTPEKEYAARMFPLRHVFDWNDWQFGFCDYWSGDADKDVIRQFRIFTKTVLDNFKMYRVPVIALDRDTSKEAVCVVFEKVNTGGKALDAFELVTAIYAADDYPLREDWYGAKDRKGRQQRLAEAYRPAGADSGVLGNVGNTDFLQAIALFHTRDMRRAAELKGKSGRDLPPVSGNRKALLNLPLTAYERYQAQVELGFLQAAKFLHMLHIYRVFDLPYQSQIVPLAAILAEIGEAWDHEAVRAKLVRWYWSGIFGELYGSTVETRIARDFVEVPVWLGGGPEPSTIHEARFHADRLTTMRTRLSAAYKGVNILLMTEGAQDFRSGQDFDNTVFFDEKIDIHHIFPQHWCKARHIPASIFNAVINKTPLSARTNRIIGGDAPSIYLANLEKGGVDDGRLDGYLRTHMIDPAILRANDFEAFMADRQRRLVGLIEKAMGKPADGNPDEDDGEDGA